MATTSPAQTGTAEPGPRRDRRLYRWASVFIPIIVLIGFARTYYLKAFFDTPAIPGLLVHIHGVVMTSWVALFVTQVSLVAAGRTKVHRRIGLLGGVLAAIVVFVGVATGISSAVRGGGPSNPAALRFLVVPLGDMLVFSILAGAALYSRRRIETHKRLMLLATLSVLSAAIARIPFHFIATGGPSAFFGLTDLIVLGCVALDTVRNHRLHPAFLWGTLLLIASQPLRLMLADTGIWISWAARLTS